jgi:hypothetical protein
VDESMAPSKTAVIAILVDRRFVLVPLELV